MIYNIQVKSRREIGEFKSEIPYVLISIRNPSDVIPHLLDDNNRIAELFLEFDDVDKDTLLQWGLKVENCIAIKDDDAEKIVEFIESYKDKVELIICQCDAGISRSAGVAAALAKVLNNNDKWVFRFYVPNRTVYGKVLEKYMEKINGN